MWCVVEGESCWPDLVPGKRYKISKAKPKIGDFVVAKTQDGVVVKKLSPRGQLVSTIPWGLKYSPLAYSILGKIVIK